MVGWVVFFQEIILLRGSILQAGTCQILSLAENPRCSRVWQLWILRPLTLLPFNCLNSDWPQRQCSCQWVQNTSKSLQIIPKLVRELLSSESLCFTTFHIIHGMKRTWLIIASDHISVTPSMYINDTQHITPLLKPKKTIIVCKTTNFDHFRNIFKTRGISSKYCLPQNLSRASEESKARG